jgi:hypothetical protein
MMHLLASASGQSSETGVPQWDHAVYIYLSIYLSNVNTGQTPADQPPIEQMLNPILLPLPDPSTQQTWTWTTANVANYLLDFIKKHQHEIPNKANDPTFTRTIDIISQITQIIDPKTDDQDTIKQANWTAEKPGTEDTEMDKEDGVPTPDEVLTR